MARVTYIIVCSIVSCFHGGHGYSYVHWFVEPRCYKVQRVTSNIIQISNIMLNECHIVNLNLNTNRRIFVADSEAQLPNSKSSNYII